ncbi:MAG: hypothetical protein CL678_09315 [Bdellovibrionaceae bacterium]|nr:hypothetical protein [Pseudobdellovibrionaceae bacterium]|tara:strand:- start:2853 stop:5606 length:2754 start_codon:yes stop_codon:yes gene_type:complete
MNQISFKVGQRLISDTEPELGTGTLTEIHSKRITVYFHGVDENRIYSQHTAPLSRALFYEGDQVRNHNGELLNVINKKEDDHLFYYEVKSQSGDISVVPESDLFETSGIQRPQDKFIRGQIDSPELFDLRSRCLSVNYNLSNSLSRGFIGPRISLLPHQFFVAQMVSELPFARALLADEVGLGKTIEAGLITHRLLHTNRISRVLIIVPKSLVYQWFIEMFRKFNLSFSIFDEESEYFPEMFSEKNLWLTSFEKIKESNVENEIINSQWDLILIDEAHHIQWSKTSVSEEYEILETLSKRVKNILLLTATPEQMGIESHFSRLHLIDPNRFDTYENYQKYQDEFVNLVKLSEEILNKNELSDDLKQKLEKKIDLDLIKKTDFKSKKNKKELCKTLADLHGTGRSYIRNTREQMEHDFHLFPKRIPIPYPLPNKTQPQEKIHWIVSLLKKNKENKFLLICQSKGTVKKIAEELKIQRIKTAVFHESLSILERDRQAAYFSDLDGAQILLCSEIGSEGRNFQFAHDLILYDLPASPDLLEQRIGRLDRIGQKKDISIHIPYIEKTKEEILYLFYEKGLNTFSSYFKGAAILDSSIWQELNKAIEAPEKSLSNKKFEKTLQLINKKAQEIELQLKNGRNSLIELISYDSDEAKKIIEQIKKNEDTENLRSFMEEIFDKIGIHSEIVSKNVDAIRPDDHMQIDIFPYLKEEGMTITYDRNIAVEREDFHFLTWDHPMVTGAIDIVLNGDTGTASLSEWKNELQKNPVLFEMIFVAETRTQKKLDSFHLFPSTPIRIVIDSELKDTTSHWPLKILNPNIQNPKKEKLNAIQSIPAQFIESIIKKGQEFADIKKIEVIDEHKQKISEQTEKEMLRLKTIYFRTEENAQKTINRQISELKNKFKLVNASLEETTLRLDSIRIVL